MPNRSGCTDDFKEHMDYLDAVFTHLSYDDVVLLGVINADPWPEMDGGPLATTSSNEQGRILLRYLRRWNYFFNLP